MSRGAPVDEIPDLDPPNPAPLCDAATVIVLRPGPRQGDCFEVLLLRRHARSAFMANAYVFPGGRVDEGDGGAGIDPHAACALLGTRHAPTDPGGAASLVAAAVRETFEEANLLLTSRGGHVPEGVDALGWWQARTPEELARMEGHRRDLCAGTTRLDALARAEELVVPLGQFALFAHWITPFFENRRFDTRFFLALAPLGQSMRHDALETTDSQWLSPGQAIARYRAHEILLAPPTLRTLEQLERFSSAAEAFAHARAQTLPVILPCAKMVDDELVLLLPGDPLFAGDDPRYAQSARVALEDGVTRMVRRNGQWWSEAVHNGTGPAGAGLRL